MITDKRLKILVSILFFVSLLWLLNDAMFYKRLVVYSDELRYLHVNDAIFNRGTLLVRGLPSDFQKIFYPLVLFPASKFVGSTMYTLVISVINCLLMSSLVPCAYCLGKNIKLSNHGIALLVVMALIMPDSMYVLTFMSENVYLPFGTFIIFLVWKNIDDLYFEKNNYIVLFLTGILFYLLYLTKEVGAAVILAYCITLVYYTIYKNLNKEQFDYNKVLKNLFCVVLVFILLFKAFKLIFFYGMSNSYSNQIGWNFDSYFLIAKYFIVALFLNLTWASLGFFYLPIIMPLCVWHNLNSREQTKYIFTLTAFLITILAVVYTITIREDYLSLRPRQHLRYLTLFFLPLCALFLKTVEVYKENINCIVRKRFISLIFLFCIAVFMLHIPFSPGSPVDQIMLSYIFKINYANAFINIALIVKILIVAFFILMGILILRKPRYFLTVFFLSILIVGLTNRSIARNLYRNIYKIDEGNIKVIQEIGVDIQNLSRRVVYIDSEDLGGFSSGEICQQLDTYLPNYITPFSLKQMKEHSDLSNRNNYISLHSLDKNINKAEYILTDKQSDVNLNKSTVKKIKTYANGLVLYSNNNPYQLVLQQPSYMFVSGWYNGENWGCWGNGPQQDLKIALDENREKLILWLQCFRKPNTIKVYFGGTLVNTILVDGTSPQKYEFMLGDYKHTSSDYLDVKLVNESQLVSPKSLGLSEDTRELGIGITKIGLDDEIVYGN